MQYQNDYKTTKWLRLRESVLRRDHYLCQLSKRYGKKKQAEMVHHIFPKDDFPEYKWESWNLISLSNEMHNTLHDRSGDELTPAGIDLLRRAARKNGIPIPQKYL